MLLPVLLLVLLLGTGPITLAGGEAGAMAGGGTAFGDANGAADRRCSRRAPDSTPPRLQRGQLVAQLFVLVEQLLQSLHQPAKEHHTLRHAHRRSHRRPGYRCRIALRRIAWHLYGIFGRARLGEDLQRARERALQRARALRQALYCGTSLTLLRVDVDCTLHHRNSR